MARLIVHNFISANGYYKGPNEDISWAKDDEVDQTEFAKEHFKPGNILIFGRVTYELMASYWPTPEAIKKYPEIAKGMNSAEKIVFSRKMKTADWNNTRVINGQLEEEIKILKQTARRDLVVLGSGSIVTQVAELRLIDELQLMVHPVIIGGGITFLNDIMGKRELTLLQSKAFKSGIVSLFYKPEFRL